MKFKSIRTYDNNSKLETFMGGPSTITSNGVISWRKNRILHRENGPAYISSRSSEHEEWWINGAYYGMGEEPPEEYLKKLKEFGIEFVRGSDEV